MDTDPAITEESGIGNYATDLMESIQSGNRSPISGNAQSSNQFDDAQLWDVLWHDAASIPSWNVEEWGWATEGTDG